MMQAKDIPDGPVLAFLRKRDPEWCLWPGTAYPNAIMRAMPEGTNHKVALAKMNALIRRGLVDGCCCGCRGDFRLTAKGMELTT